MSAVHYDRDGLPRCGNAGARQLSADKGAVDCLMCLNIMAAVNGVGARQSDAFCGTPARYRWHLRHQGAPVRCIPCLEAEARRGQDSPHREAQNARRRQRYAAARAAGATYRQASRRKDLGRAA